MRTGGWLLLAGVGLGLMLAMSLLQPVTWVDVTTGDGARLGCVRVDGETPITLRFTHSMFGGAVSETYRVRDDGLLERRRMVTENAAAAEYYATDGAIRAVPDGYEVIAPPFATDRLAIRVDARGNHHLTIGTAEWPLYEQLRTSVRVTLDAHRTARSAVPQSCGNANEEQGLP